MMNNDDVKSWKDWAKREIDLVTSDDENEENHEYCEAVYQSFCSFLDKTENLPLSKQNLKKIMLTKLLNVEPLTPIEDNEEDWKIIAGFDPGENLEDPGWSIYKSNRLPTLFKKVTYGKKDGDSIDIRYSDTNRAVCIDIDTKQTYNDDMALAILDEMLPISMPYSYSADKIKIFTERFKAYEDTGEFDTIGILYFRLLDGSIKEVKRFFKEDCKTHKMVEIDITEYFMRKKKSEAMERKKIKEIFDDSRRPNK